MSTSIALLVTLMLCAGSAGAQQDTALVFEVRGLIPCEDPNSDIEDSNGERLCLSNDVAVTLAHVDSATFRTGDRWTPYEVTVFLNATGRTLMSDFTVRWLNKRIAIIVDGQIVRSPVVMTKISKGTVRFGVEDQYRAGLIVDQLNNAVGSSTH